MYEVFIIKFLHFSGKEQDASSRADHCWTASQRSQREGTRTCSASKS